MCYRTRYALKGVMVGKVYRHLECSPVIQSVSEACHSEGIQCPKKLLGRVYPLERTPICGEVCVASEVFQRKVKFVYDK